MTARSSLMCTASLALVLSIPAVAASQSHGASRPPKPAPVDTATVVVSRPTVIAYLVIPKGAVDTSADLAVLADDWNFAMATLGDSLEAHGIAFTIVTESRLRMRVTGQRDVVLALDDPTAAGYVLARPGSAPCVRRRPAEPDDVLRAARTLATRGMTTEARTRASCTVVR
jgi:hypothetical protein